MRAIRSKNMQPELTVRRLVHSLGYRFRLHQTNLAGKPDLVFAKRNKVIFVHGCFWHSHNCEKAHVPRSNKEYWRVKLSRNRQRDKKNLKGLRSAGWGVLVVWECEIASTQRLSAQIRRFLQEDTKTESKMLTR